MDSLGARLKAERQRLGMSQTELGKIGGVGKTTQINYEKGASRPDAEYLTDAAAAGVDVNYVLTGHALPDQEVPSPIDVERFVRIIDLLEGVAAKAGKQWPARKLALTTVQVYNYLLDEPDAEDEAKVERVLKLVVNN